MRHLWIAAVAVAVVAAKLFGAYTLGFVASGSMEPTMPQGSVFMAVAGDPEVGDIVVFAAATGERVVHRVVAIRPDGLVTKGDANERDDVASGLGPVDPANVQIVPTLRGSPAAISGEWLRPTAIVAVQVVFLTIGIRGLLRSGAQSSSHLRPHHAVLASAVLLLLTGPLYHDSTEAFGEMGVRAAFVPTVARVVAPAAEAVTIELEPLQEKALAAAGHVSVVYAPAMPGAKWLLQFGSTAAILPAVAMLAGIALFMRSQGW